MENLTSAGLSASIRQSLNLLESVHSDVHGLIFQHFTAADAKRFSMLNRDYFAATEDSPQCWQKTELKISRLKMFQIGRPFAADLASLRKYQNVVLEADEEHEMDIDAALSILQRRQCNSVHLVGFNCELSQLHEVLKIIEPTVQELSLHSVTIQHPAEGSVAGNSESDTPVLKLKSLRLYDCRGFRVQDIVGDCRTLESLKLSLVQSDTTLEKVLQYSDKLENFEITIKYDEATFPSPRNQFKLKSFVFASYRNWRDQVGLFNFIQNQALNLEKLDITTGVDLQMIQLIFRIPKLRNLTISLDRGITDAWKQIVLHRNPKITSFKLSSMTGLDENKNNFLIKLFQSMPSLIILEAPDATHYSAYGQLGLLCQEIEELNVHYAYNARLTDLPDLPNIERFHGVAKSLVGQIQAKVENQNLTRLENLILQMYSKEKSESP